MFLFFSLFSQNQLQLSFNQYSKTLDFFNLAPTVTITAGSAIAEKRQCISNFFFADSEPQEESTSGLQRVFK